MSCWTLVWQERRQPCSNCCLEKVARSVSSGGSASLTIFTLHCLHVALPPHGEGIGIPESNREDNKVRPLSTVFVRVSSSLIFSLQG
ncbi:Uncharacterised protein [Chlamydia abortus]|nr:Uncharacterised protein [Chlamydia abortus]